MNASSLKNICTDWMKFERQRCSPLRQVHSCFSHLLDSDNVIYDFVEDGLWLWRMRLKPNMCISYICLIHIYCIYPSKVMLYSYLICSKGYSFLLSAILGFWIQSFVLIRQVLDYLSCASSSHFLIYWIQSIWAGSQCSLIIWLWLAYFLLLWDMVSGWWHGSSDGVPA
jgi:hypothetical protein